MSKVLSVRSLSRFLIAMGILSMSWLYGDTIRKLGDWVQIGLPAYGLYKTYEQDDMVGAYEWLGSFGNVVIATHALKSMVGRERPDGSDDKSFPSGHTSAAFSGAAFLQVRYFGQRPWVNALNYTLASFVGYSRVHAKKHFVSDVLAGALLGFLGTYAVVSAFEPMQVFQVNYVLSDNQFLFKMQGFF